MEKRPFVTREQLEKIAETYPTPFYLYDEKGIRENARAPESGIFLEQGLPGVFCGEGHPESVHS